jgi:hypothetical protein
MKFRRDAVMEMVLKMKANEPAEFNRLQDKTKAAAAIYERQKREAMNEKEDSPKAA